MYFVLSSSDNIFITFEACNFLYICFFFLFFRVSPPLFLSSEYIVVRTVARARLFIRHSADVIFEKVYCTSMLREECINIVDMENMEKLRSPRVSTHSRRVRGTCYDES